MPEAYKILEKPVILVEFADDKQGEKNRVIIRDANNEEHAALLISSRHPGRPIKKIVRL